MTANTHLAHNYMSIESRQSLNISAALEASTCLKHAAHTRRCTLNYTSIHIHDNYYSSCNLSFDPSGLPLPPSAWNFFLRSAARRICSSRFLAFSATLSSSCWRFCSICSPFSVNHGVRRVISHVCTCYERCDRQIDIPLIFCFRASASPAASSRSRDLREVRASATATCGCAAATFRSSTGISKATPGRMLLLVLWLGSGPGVS